MDLQVRVPLHLLSNPLCRHPNPGRTHSALRWSRIPGAADLTTTPPALCLWGLICWECPLSSCAHKITLLLQDPEEIPFGNLLYCLRDTVPPEGGACLCCHSCCPGDQLVCYQLCSGWVTSWSLTSFICKKGLTTTSLSEGLLNNIILVNLVFTLLFCKFPP